MNLFISKYLFLVLTCFLTISIYGQKNVTKEKHHRITSIISNQKNTPAYASNMQIHNPNYELDQKINQTLINDTKPVIMPIYKPYLSLETALISSTAITRHFKTIEEIRKELKNN